MMRTFRLRAVHRSACRRRSSVALRTVGLGQEPVGRRRSTVFPLLSTFRCGQLFSSVALRPVAEAALAAATDGAEDVQPGSGAYLLADPASGARVGGVCALRLATYAVWARCRLGKSIARPRAPHRARVYAS